MNTCQALSQNKQLLGMRLEQVYRPFRGLWMLFSLLPLPHQQQAPLEMPSLPSNHDVAVDIYERLIDHDKRLREIEDVFEWLHLQGVRKLWGYISLFLWIAQYIASRANTQEVIKCFQHFQHIL
jgi:hypothetical protein